MKKFYILICCMFFAAMTFSQGVTELHEGFETVDGTTFVPTGWLSVDDGDGYAWRQLTDGNERTGSAYVGTGANTGGVSNDWLITQQVEVSNGYELSFWYRAAGASWPDTISVNISKTGTAEGDFTINLDTLGTASEEYAKYSIVLSDLAGISAGDQIYIGLNYIGSGWYICIDDLAYELPTTIEEGFEVIDNVTYVPAGWLSIDDGDAYPWRQLSDGKQRSGDYYVGTGPYYPAGGGVTNDWMITPRVEVVEGNVLSFWYRAAGAAWPDSITIRISKTGTSFDDFTVTLDTIGASSETYTKFSYVLTDHVDITAGDQVYIGLNYIGSGWFICVDDFRLGEAEGPDPKDALLSDLTLGGITINGFDPETIEYDVYLNYLAEEVPAAGGTANNPALTPVVTDATELPGSSTVVVTSVDLSVTKTYTIHFKLYVPQFEEGFETGVLSVLPEGWTVVDEDADELSWYRGVDEAKTDSSFAGCYSYTETASDDWLISPAISLHHGSTLSFYARAGGAAWPEAMAIRVSKTDTELASFDITIDSIKALADIEYVRYEYVLTDYDDITAGDQVHIAFQRYSTLGWYILVDDVIVSVPLESAASLSDLAINGTTIDGFSPVVYEYEAEVDEIPEITAVATNAALIPVITNVVSLPGFATITVVSDNELVTEIYTIELMKPVGVEPGKDISEIAVYPQPASDYIYITDTEPGRVSFYNMTGSLVKVVNNPGGDKSRIDVTDLKQGLYLLKIQSGDDIVVKEFSLVR